MEKSANELIKIIRDYPEDWMLSRYTAENKKLEIEIWIANGFSSCGIYRVLGNQCGNLSQWNLFDRLKVWKELKKLPDYLVLKAIAKNKSN